MSKTFIPENSTVHLTTGRIRNIMEILNDKYLVHRYFGKAIRAWHGSGNLVPFKRSYIVEFPPEDNNIYFDDLTFEYPTLGRGDYRLSALTVVGSSRTAVLDLKFQSLNLLEHKSEEKSLSISFDNENESEILELICIDNISGVKVHLYYAIFKNLYIIARHQRIENIGQSIVKISNAQSLSLELLTKLYDFLSLYDCYGKEANTSCFLCIREYN